jgi:hypothetical protein
MEAEYNNNYLLLGFEKKQPMMSPLIRPAYNNYQVCIAHHRPDGMFIFILL